LTSAAPQTTATTEPAPTTDAPQATAPTEPAPTTDAPQATAPTNADAPASDRVAPEQTQEATAAANQAHVFLDQAQIDTIKTKVQAGEEPWATAYTKLMADAEAALVAEPFSITKNGGPDGGHEFATDAPYCGWSRVDGRQPDCRDGQINKQADRQDYSEAIAASRAVRDLGLAYVITDDTRYADQAVRIIRVWSIDPATRMAPMYTTKQSQIELSITLPGMFYGADLLETYPDWPTEEQRAFQEWVAAIAESAKGWSSKNNFENWRVNFIAAAGAYLDNQALLDYAFDRYRSIISAQIDNEGRMVEELERSAGLGYSLYAINAMIQTAEIARHHNVDLYNYTTADGVGLKRAVDFHARYALAPEQWPYKQEAPLKPEDNLALFELAYAYWGEPAYLDVINRWGRPMQETRILGPVSLTHAAKS
jgi:hypothetical protein